MQTISTEGSFDDLVGRYSEEIQGIARRLRALIEEVHPEAIEVLWVKQGIAGFGVGPKKMTEHHSYIAPQKGHVNLGFYRGAVLPDPEGLLEGTGQAMRHAKVRTLEDTERPALKALLAAALAERRAALGLE